ENPTESFEFGAQAFDLADRLQTPIFVMLDLDIGMNHHLSQPLAWDDSRKYDRGKVMTAAELEAGKEFGRYLDVDGDGIPYRTYPGPHPPTASPTGPIRARIRPRARSSRAAPRAIAMRATPKKAHPMSITCSD